MRSSLIVLAAAAALVPAACASTGGSSSVSSSRDITAEQLAEASHDNLYDYLRDHPRLEIAYNRETGEDELRIRGRGGDARSLYGGYAGVLVVVNGTRTPDPLSALRTIQLDEVTRVRILYASEAGAAYGTGSSNGVIEITTG